MSKIDWEKPVMGKSEGTDGLGVVVSFRQQTIQNTPCLHIDLLVYPEETIADPRSAIEAAITTLKKELGI